MATNGRSGLIHRVLFDEPRLQAMVSELAGRIDRDYEFVDGELVFVGILKSALHFFSDLSRRVKTPHALDFLTARSYHGETVSSGRVELVQEPAMDLRGRHVLLVEDIYDTGGTLARVMEFLREREPASLEACVLFSKPSAHVEQVSVKYVGAEIDDQFVVGYGLDYREQYRDLPYVGVLTLD